ncbi:LpxI family protein [Methylacidiphilum caldifontis]|uniref:UDP-2,3-diacylglucosamine pyrophosphatase n=1 Tax=Methylacidiphilum caldifontis TaxID=2795386 RepID=A0A4Y8PFK4_9BACT|nr:UDP-2,3-diacylglucosamine diphosphatase LpxI [Methylacidiphilum caldifontis]QSR88361.1 UDP-2,3-diacylglucosamine diphosphatase LpxI [Methylacidiphilum caldifontis]TFE70665.1 hypothetical protein A7Q10_06265 [Methylacidiphilum caldifontis]
MIDNIQKKPLFDLDYPLGIIAGRGVYPLLVAEGAKKAGIEKIFSVCFISETDPKMESLSASVEWIRVGQLSRMLHFFKKNEVKKAIMAGGIAPSHLFELRPDIKTILLIAKLKERNAHTLFGAVAGELEKNGVLLLKATTFLEDQLVPSGHFGGPPIKKRIWGDVEFGFKMAKEIARLDIGQSVVVKNGTVLSVEAFEGTDETMKRGGELAKGGAMLVKVSKPDQDFRFDVPVIGLKTIETASRNGIGIIVCESLKTLVLEKQKVIEMANLEKISLVGFP